MNCTTSAAAASLTLGDDLYISRSTITDRNGQPLAGLHLYPTTEVGDVGDCVGTLWLTPIAAATLRDALASAAGQVTA